MRALAIAIFAAAALATSADACIPIVYREPGRYVGGDLAQQIVRKAPTIQIVRATERHLLSRTDMNAEYFYNSGEWPDESEDESMGAPGRYQDVYVYVFEVVETLKGGALRRDQSPLRILSEPLEEADSTLRDVLERPWIFPLARLDVPAVSMAPDVPPGEPVRKQEESYAVFPMDWRPAGEGGGCLGEFRLAIGETYVVLRDEYGRPYFGGPRYETQRGLPIEAQIGDQSLTINAPALVRIVGPDDPYLVRLRAALGATR